MPVPHPSFGAAEGPLTLLHLPSGTTAFFNDRAAAAAFMRAQRVGRLTGDPVAWRVDPFVHEDRHAVRLADWSLTNVFGEALSWADLPEPPRRSWYGRLDPWEIGERRRDPVAGTGVRRPYCRWRHPKTLRLLREAAAREDTDAPCRRTTRGRDILPTAWDDKQRGTQRNWKKQRRTRWKG